MENTEEFRKLLREKIAKMARGDEAEKEAAKHLSAALQILEPKKPVANVSVSPEFGGGKFQPRILFDAQQRMKGNKPH